MPVPYGAAVHIINSDIFNQLNEKQQNQFLNHINLTYLVGYGEIINFETFNRSWFKNHRHRIRDVDYHAGLSQIETRLESELYVVENYRKITGAQLLPILESEKFSADSKTKLVRNLAQKTNKHILSSMEKTRFCEWLNTDATHEQINLLAPYVGAPHQTFIIPHVENTAQQATVLVSQANSPNITIDSYAYMDGYGFFTERQRKTLHRTFKKNQPRNRQRALFARTQHT